MLLGSPQAAGRLARRLPPYRVYRRANWLMTRVPGAGVLRTGPMTAKWAAKAWARSRSGRPDGQPTARPTGLLAAQVAIDEAVLGLMMRPSKFPSTADYERVGEELAAAASLFAERGWTNAPELYHQDPPPIDAHRVRPARWMLDRFEHLSWESGFRPHPDEPAAERWRSYTETHTAHAYLLRHAEDRPWLICLHGFGAGFPAADFACFRARHLHEELGLNVALPVMPLHGRRAVDGANDLLSFDLLNTVLGLSHAIWDTRRLLGWIRSQTDQPVGTYGVSLGGYTGGLLATLDDVDLSIAGIPAVDFPALFRHHAPNRVERAARNRGVLGDNATAVHRVISPLALPVRTPADRRFIYAGLGDRMVPPPQPRALWEHWERPPVLWYPGNHMGFMWSSKVKQFLDDALVSSGFVDPATVAAAA